MKRQRGRGRKPNGQQNRHFESNGPDIKIRGSATHVHEKYQQLARDAASAGDRIMAENYAQHAEHYFRIVRTQQEAQRERAEAQGPRNDGGGRDNAGGDSASSESNPLDVVDPEAGETKAAGPGESEEREEGKPRRARRTRRPRSAEPTDAEAREALDASESAPADQAPGA